MQRIKSLDESYEILGVGSDVPFQYVTEAYQDLVKVWHPDRFANHPRLQKKAEEKLKEINDAYNRIILSRQGPSHKSADDHPSNIADAPRFSGISARLRNTKTSYRVMLFGLVAAIIAIWVSVVLLALKTGDIAVSLAVPTAGLLILLCVYYLRRLWDWIDAHMFLPLERKLKSGQLAIDLYLDKLEARVRQKLSPLGIQIRALRSDQRRRLLFIAVVLVIGFTVNAHYVFFAYDDEKHQLLRTNRLTGTRVLKFKDKEHNAAVVAAIAREMGLSVEKVNVGRDGEKWIVAEDYAKAMDRRQTRMELERTRRELEGMREEMRQRESEARREEIAKESDARLSDLLRESERQNQEVQRRWQLQRLEDAAENVSRHRR